jgi:ferredoxin
MGCGICASECPARAIRVGHFEAKQFIIMLDELFNIQGDADFNPVSLPE